ncbi:MAG: hypothetical protein IKB13_11235 [Clostridia bacterium]|nr:hypothetical protein [Clostridia bacterium]
MKKCISLLLVAIFIFCSMPITTMAKTPSNAMDIGLDCLGAAFDLTKSHELIRSNTKSLIDSEKVKNSNLIYGMSGEPLTYSEYYSGKDLSSYAHFECS